MNHLRAILTGIFCLLSAQVGLAAENGDKIPAGFKPAEKLPYWHERVQQFCNDAPHPGCYLFLGNSLTEGFDLKVYFPDWPVVNRGIKSDHLDGMLDRLGSVVDQQPERLFLLAGINDIGRGCPTAHIKILFEKLVDSLQIRLPDCELYVQSILPTTARWKNCAPDTIELMNLFLEKMAAEKSAHFIDLHVHMTDSTGHFLRPELTRDGLHLNEAGYAIWADVLRKMISK